MKAAIVGVTGYTGIELLRIIQGHPQLTVGTIHSCSMHKHSIEEDYPHLQGVLQLPVQPFDPEQIMAKNDLVFLLRQPKQRASSSLSGSGFPCD